jgi:hypothetical protein
VVKRQRLSYLALAPFASLSPDFSSLFFKPIYATIHEIDGSPVSPSEINRKHATPKTGNYFFGKMALKMR